MPASLVFFFFTLENCYTFLSVHSLLQAALCFPACLLSPQLLLASSSSPSRRRLVQRGEQRGGSRAPRPRRSRRRRRRRTTAAPTFLLLLPALLYRRQRGHGGRQGGVHPLDRAGRGASQQLHGLRRCPGVVRGKLRLFDYLGLEKASRGQGRRDRRADVVPHVEEPDGRVVGELEGAGLEGGAGGRGCFFFLVRERVFFPS